MKARISILCAVLCWCFIATLSAQHYHPLDTLRPVQFMGDRIRYQGREIVLGPKAFFIDGSLPDEVAARHPYVFTRFNDAAARFAAGTPDDPMEVYIAPYVYWIDDPDDPAVRVGKDGREPFGLVVECPYLHLTGLCSDPRNVVLASSRGQTQGAVGNFTMFDFWGDGLEVRNLTMGNFCNVDLEYPLKPELGRGKRMTAITQAHVAYCHGDRILAEDVRFISRLNMNPLSGAKRILFNRCHMESTDDALAATGVYLNCTLEFYGQKPFWRSDMGGAVFLNCDFYVKHDEPRQYFCKGVGPLSIIDCRYHAGHPMYAGWTHEPTGWLRCYQYNVKMDGQPYVIGADQPYNTVCLDRLPSLKAFRLTDGEGRVVYNTYNLLRGDDGWDPMGVQAQVEAIGKAAGEDYTRMPTCLSVEPLAASIQTGGDALVLSARVKRHCNYTEPDVTVGWKVQPGYERFVRLTPTPDGRCVVEAVNHEDATRRFTVVASTADGLECAVELTVAPDFVPAPAFLEKPALRVADGYAKVVYRLDLKGRADQSVVNWYKCTDPSGGKRYPVAVSRMDEPLCSYRLTKEDVGYYLMATVSPKHLRCLPGTEQVVVSPLPIRKEEVCASERFETDFRNFPCTNQPDLLPGIWTVGGYKPLDTEKYDWQVYPDKEYWEYGEGMNGAKGTGLLQKERGARMLYTPLEGTYGDMKVTLNVDASKTAGQGFGSATGQYLDLYIKFDTHTLTGYALRVIRTTKYSNAVDFLLMRYENGQAVPITEPVSSTCYRTDCTITLETRGGRLYAHAETTTPLSSPVTDPNLKRSVDLEVAITPNKYGGTGVQHTGSCGESTTMLHRMKVEWK